MNNKRIRIGLVGARGYVGSELIRIIGEHPQFELGFVSSRERVGQSVSVHEASYLGDLNYVNLDAEQAAQQSVDALILALPNDMAAAYVTAVDQHAPQTVLLDLSADYRFDQSWYYGLPELTRAEAAGKKRISNPGCYATAMQLAIAPMSEFIAGAVQCFGVSGYSGAGTSPSDKNNPETLRDNLIPYHLTGHIHEREVSFHSRHAIEFMPHVAPHFRGLTVTSNIHLKQAMPLHGITEIYGKFYQQERLIQVMHEAPWVSRSANQHNVQIGGFSLSASHQRLVVVSTLDNLLKGAATQAIQNLNLAFGLEELAGIHP
ncbi:MAG: N-acetyl-gamma-glutamyl-phosphate reductase [Arenimonas sp.]